MNPGQLSALFAAHKTAILGGGAAAVAGLALYQRKKGGAGAGASTVGARVPGTIPAAAVVPAGGSVGAGGYDSSSFDTYNALQPEIDQILQRQEAQQTGGTAGGGVTAAPAPVASTLLSPSSSNNYVRFADGQIDQVESDGSLYWLSPTESAKAFGKGGWKGKVNQLNVKPPTNVFSAGKNILARNQSATSGAK